MTRLTKSLAGDQAYSVPQHRGRLHSVRMQLVGRHSDKRHWMERRGQDPAVALVETGAGALRDEHGQMHRFEGPAVLWFPAGCRVGYGPEHGWREHFVVVTGARVADWQDAGWLSVDAACWVPAEAKTALAAHRSAVSHCAHGSDDAIDAACLAIEQFIYACRPTAVVIDADPLDRVLDAWRRDPAQASIDGGAALLGVSVSRLRALVSQRYGMPPQRIIQGERIAAACADF